MSIKEFDDFMFDFFKRNIETRYMALSSDGSVDFLTDSQAFDWLAMYAGYYGA